MVFWETMYFIVNCSTQAIIALEKTIKSIKPSIIKSERKNIPLKINSKKNSVHSSNPTQVK